MRATLVVFTEQDEGLLWDIVKTIDGIERFYAEAIGTSALRELRSLLGKLRAVSAPTSITGTVPDDDR